MNRLLKCLLTASWYHAAMFSWFTNCEMTVWNLRFLIWNFVGPLRKLYGPSSKCSQAYGNVFFLANLLICAILWTIYICYVLNILFLCFMGTILIYRPRILLGQTRQARSFRLMYCRSELTHFCGNDRPIYCKTKCEAESEAQCEATFTLVNKCVTNEREHWLDR